MQIVRLAAAAVLVSAATGAVAENRIDRIRPDAPELASYGEHPVGVRTMTFTREGVPDVPNATQDDVPVTDREMTVEVWYPAAEGTEPGTAYTAFLRDGQTEVQLQGRAARDAAPVEGETFPVVIISHGYPGNRFLMSHLGENLASKGYVTASIDHPDSTYSDMGAFTSTLVNRPWDQAFVLESLAGLDDDLGAIIDGETAGVIGYSMGGYGALIFAGAGVTEAAVAGESGNERYSPPAGLLEVNQAGTQSHQDLVQDRVKAVVAFGPWGRNRDFWDAEGLAGIEKPLLLIAGGVDDVSEYDAIREIFDETTGTTRHLLTYESANHNAGAPMPPPEESWEPVESLDFVPFEHYADAVWDNVRMNNIAQHFVTAFLDLHLKGMEDRAEYLDLVENSEDGVYAVADDGTPAEDNTYWAGFADRTAKGLRFETKEAQ